MIKMGEDYASIVKEYDEIHKKKRKLKHTGIYFIWETLSTEKLNVQLYNVF